MAKMYRSSQGKGIDLGALLLQNETVRAVGNMNVNARGDRIDNRGKSIDSRVQQKKRQYNKQIGPQDVLPDHNVTTTVPPIVPVQEKIAVKPVAKKKTPAKKTVKKSTPVIDESILDVEATATVPVQPAVAPPPPPPPAVKEEAPTKPKTGGLADAIARAKQIKQEASVPPRQAAQQQPGVKKI